jgi:hypothetical protein
MRGAYAFVDCNRYWPEGIRLSAGADCGRNGAHPQAVVDAIIVQERRASFRVV